MMDWQIKNVPPETRRKIKAFAKKNNLHIAGALTVLVEKLDESD